MIFRVVWEPETTDRRVMAQEYATFEEAMVNRDDIAGWIPNARIVEINEDRPPERGPFQVKEPSPPGNDSK
jgi:hypothetical protein